MRLYILIFILLLHSTTAFAIDNDREVIVNGRVALYESVVKYCNGDTARAVAMCVPIASEGSYMSRPRLIAEDLYNAAHADKWPAAVMLVCAVLALAGAAPPRLLTALSALTSALVCVWIWWLGGWIPLMSISDTLAVVALFLCVCMLFVRRRITIAAGLSVAALLWGVACITGVHPAVRPLNHALTSSWLPVHVTLITVAYALFLFAALRAVSGPVGKKTLRILVWGEALLAAGVVAGGLWAMSAWGRFWGWDPKECCALATAIIYGALILSWEKTDRRRILTIAASGAVAATWWGASHLGGLHSY